MIEIILLTTIVVGQIVVVWAVFELKWSFEAWTAAWGKNPLPASDYHAKEVLKTLEEIAHMMAVERNGAENAPLRPHTQSPLPRTSEP